MSTAKKAFFAAVGAGRSAYDRALALPERARKIPDQVRSLATDATRKATATFEDYARKGERLVTSVKPAAKEKPARTPKPKAAPVEEPPAIEIVG